MGARIAELDALLEQLGSLDRGALLALHAAWRAVDPDARAEAWREARAASRATGRDKTLDGALDAVATWASALEDLTGWEGGGGLPELTLADIRRTAAPAVLDAVAALVTWDMLREADRQALVGPWESIAGPA